MDRVAFGGIEGVEEDGDEYNDQRINPSVLGGEISPAAKVRTSSSSLGMRTRNLALGTTLLKVSAKPFRTISRIPTGDNEGELDSGVESCAESGAERAVAVSPLGSAPVVLEDREVRAMSFLFQDLDVTLSRGWWQSDAAAKEGVSCDMISRWDG